jgi:RNA polymerase sigma factor (sigma-70 family)
MTRAPLDTVIRHLHKLVGGEQGGGLSDADLLRRFLDSRDEAAFEVLVWRHGTMVLNVCRRILACEQDIEDAFQATFLALVREARSISQANAVAGWLYKVAYRVALRIKARLERLPASVGGGIDLLAAGAADDAGWHDLRPVLDEEVNRLPEKYRLPVILCYLEGKTNEEAAQQLHCPRGTIATRLAWARGRLR